MAWQKSLVGEGVFTHEAGIHVDGLLKDRRNYEGFDPSEVGREHRTVLDKHSGSSAVAGAYARLGLLISTEQAQQLLIRIRRHVMQTKREPSGEDLQRFYLEAAPCAGIRHDT